MRNRQLGRTVRFKCGWCEAYEGSRTWGGTPHSTHATQPIFMKEAAHKQGQVRACTCADCQLWATCYLSRQLCISGVLSALFACKDAIQQPTCGFQKVRHASVAAARHRQHPALHPVLHLRYARYYTKYTCPFSHTFTHAQRCIQDICNRPFLHLHRAAAGSTNRAACSCGGSTTLLAPPLPSHFPTQMGPLRQPAYTLHSTCGMMYRAHERFV